MSPEFSDVKSTVRPDMFVSKDCFDVEKLLIDTKLNNLEENIDRTDKKVDNLEVKLDKMVDKIDNITKFVAYVAVIVSVILIGVLVGRGLDFLTIFK
jgi:hypothetical protein